MLKTAILLIALIVTAYLIYSFVKQYRSASGTLGERFRAAGRGSATIVVQKVAIIVSAVTALIYHGLDLTAPFLNDQGFVDQAKQGIQSYFTPTTATIGLIAFAGITILARLRSLKA